MLRKLILKTLYVLIICSILIFTSQCGFPRKSLSPDEVVNNSESLVGQNVTIRGIVQMSNFVTCTEEEFYEVMRESSLGREWLVWHESNPHFFEHFERFTFEAIRRGHTRLSG